MTENEFDTIKTKAPKTLQDAKELVENESTTVFPIHKLNPRVTEKLSKIVSADIPGNINKGLSNEICFIDEDTNITDTASIIKSPLTGETYVKISAAFMQYVWLLNDIALRSIDLDIIKESCKDFGIDYNEYSTITARITEIPVEELKKLFRFPDNIDVNHYVDYLKRSLSLQNPTDYEKQISYDVMLLRRLCSPKEKFTKSDFANVNLDGDYEGLINGVYCYSIAFAMLHELSHFALGHLEKADESIDDERNADINAFWDIFSDTDEKEKFTAIVGILCLLFALLMLNPTMEEDGIHPREDHRIFEIYDNVKDDNPKYTVLLVRLFQLWAHSNDIDGFPQVVDDSLDSLQQIRSFLVLWK